MKTLLKSVASKLLDPLVDLCDRGSQAIRNTDIKTRASIIIAMILMGFVLGIFSKLFFVLWLIVFTGLVFNWPRSVQLWIRNL